MSAGERQTSTQLQVLHAQLSLSSGHTLYLDEMMDSTEAQKIFMFQKNKTEDWNALIKMLSAIPALQTQNHSTENILTLTW